MLRSNAFKPSEEIIDKVRRYYNQTPESVKKNVDILKEWIKQQRHFPQNVTDDFIERCLLRTKFQAEVAKDKLEKYYTMRGIHSETFRDIPMLLPSHNTDWVVPMPTLTNNLERIVIIKVNPALVDKDTDVMKFFKFVMCTSEYTFRCDYVAGYRLVQDFENFSFAHFKRFASKVAIYSSMYQEAYLNVITGIEYVNMPSFLDVFMQSCRLLLKPKLYERITIHKNYESLHQNVDKQFLPKEYGGECGMISDYLEIWDKEFEANREVFNEILLKEISNEHLRVGDVKYNEIFGVDGTFKSLNLD